MRKRVKKVSKIAMITMVIFSIVILLTVFYLVNKHTKRPLYSQERLILHAKNHQILLDKFGAQSVKLLTDDGIELSAFFIARPQAKRNMIICHGYRMCKERMLPFAHMFINDNILIFDYRAHGESKGDRTTIGLTECLDVKAALSWMQQNTVSYLPIIGIGVSMGAVSLLGAAANHPGFNAIILDSPFAHLQDQAKKAFKNKYKISGYFLERIAISFFNYLLACSLDQIDATCWAQQLKIPVLLIHSHDDRTVAFDQAEKVFAHLASPQKELWAVSGFGHAKIFEEYSQQYHQKIEQFLNKILIT